MELGEIESLINEIEGIEQVVVIDKEKENKEKYLIGYYVCSFEIDSKKIREYLKTKLPIYMIPSYFQRIEKIPLTKNGKLNRKNLPEPNKEDIIKEQYIVPETVTEKKICSIYSVVLNYPENLIGKMSDFYELGGDSLNVIRIISEIEKEFRLRINIKDILSRPIISELSEYIDKITMDEDDLSHRIEIIKKRHHKEFPITSQQMGVYLDSIKNSGSIIYNIPLTFKLNKNVNIERVKESIKLLFEKQEILKSKYVEKNIEGNIKIYGVIDENINIDFEEYTSENMNNFVRPFNLAEGPLFRVGLIGKEVLMMDIHHIICDGTTVSIIKKAIEKYYNKGEIKELEIQFSDYAFAVEEKKKNNYFENQIEFYRTMFNDDYDILSIPQKDRIERKRLNELNGNSNLCSRSINKDISKIIDDYISVNGVSKTSFFLSIYGFILSKYSGQDNIYTSIVSANRNNHYTKDMIGMFVSTHPILLKYSTKTPNFDAIIKNNMNKLIEIYNHQDLSFSELINQLKIKKVNNTFVFQPKSIIKDSEKSFVFNNEDHKDLFSIMENFYKLNNNEKTSKFDIIFNVIEQEEDYLITLEYDEKLYEKKMIDRIIDSYIEVIRNINEFSNSIDNIEYIPFEEKEKIIKEFNSNEYKYECDKFFHVEFSKIAERNKNKIAIISNDEKFSYGILDEMTNSIAHYLRSLNVGRNTIVPIICERSYYYVIGIIGIMKAGGAFLPIDPEYPEERIKFMIEEVEAKIVLKYVTNNEYNEKLKNIENVLIYSMEQHNYKENIYKIDNINDVDDTCYCLFTSGTTGKPKGTLISHFNLINYSLYAQTYNGKEIFTNNFGVSLCSSKFTFDMSICEILYPLIKLKSVVISNEDECNNPNLLGNLINKFNIDYIFITPSRLHYYLKDENYSKSINNIKCLLMGGEGCNKETLREIINYTDGNIYNLYGPTETTIMCTISELSKKFNKSNKNVNKITIGKPLCNCKLYILDKYLKPVPIGVEGEIYIGGYCVGKGYLNRKNLTQEKFVECPYSSEKNSKKLMYSTGDLGKWTEEGEIECLGRIDFQ
ncbi:hypothetical protein PIROE2DRAFT_18982, partial [Piromyces sp. E2]